jgi:hypothetical protein
MSSPDWKPFIEPTNLEIAKDGKKISFQSIPKTDWWRTGKVHSTNGAYVAVEHEKTLERVKSLELKASVHLEGDHQVSRCHNLLSDSSPRADSHTRFSVVSVFRLYIPRRAQHLSIQRPRRHLPLHLGYSMDQSRN